jgi:hypothetical protein
VIAPDVQARGEWRQAPAYTGASFAALGGGWDEPDAGAYLIDWGAKSYPSQIAVILGGADRPPAPRLLDEVWRHLRRERYRLCTQRTCEAWIGPLILVNGKRYRWKRARPRCRSFFIGFPSADARDRQQRVEQRPLRLSAR